MSEVTTTQPNAATVLILGGDGIGPEVTAQAERVIRWAFDHAGRGLEVSHDLAGGCSYDAHGVPLTDEALAHAHRVDAVLLGAVGGPKYDTLDFALRPEAALLKLRKDLELFANLRPAMVFPALVDASALKPEIVSNLDILIIRELTGGVYFGEPRGVETLPDGTRRGVNTHVYDEHEIARVARVAFDAARARRNKVCSTEKSNVMEAGRLWREVVTEVHAAEYADVELSHMLADNCSMQLVRAPKQFDVILTDNLFGDMLSDQAAMLTGSLGMLPSASLGAADENGRRPAMYEPVHGSAPDIAGKGIANPLATILSAAMMLRLSFAMGDQATLVETAVSDVLGEGVRTGDIAAPGSTSVGTQAMGDAVIGALERLAN